GGQYCGAVDGNFRGSPVVCPQVWPCDSTLATPVTALREKGEV
ncbi:MAG: hypothetical protein RLZZ568_1350, partial [Cyanobacteriota bacterium]